ncbi:MAG TPA: M14 family metallopeptidase [Terriglobales bacterium]|nr:M14 family metallopeptidase [Terriglobales bacterium]
MRQLLWVAVVTSALASFAGAQQAAFRVGTARALAGTKATGYLEVPAGRDAGTRLPVVVVRGARPGPVLALVAGAHGTEYASILAVEQLIVRLDASRLSGTVILLPLVNLQSFLRKVPHVNPVDGKSMNGFYPGSADGTQTDRVSYAITQQVVERCDYLVDYHGGDLDENLRPYSYWSKTGNAAQDAMTRRMDLAFGLDHIIVATDRPRDPKHSRFLDNTASTRGKPAIAVEAGRAGRVDAGDVAALVNGTLNLMRLLKMLPGTAAMLAHPVWIDKVDTVTSPEEGIFYPSVERGATVAAGAELGTVTDYFGKTIFEARAPAAGEVLLICAVPTMNRGGTVADVGEISKTP